MSEGAPKSVAKTGEEPTKIIEIGGKKFEVGPFFWEMEWNGMNEKVTELNKTLKTGEKEWRILTIKEYVEIGKPIKEISYYKSTDSQAAAKIKEYLDGLGFKNHVSYWSSSEDPIDRNNAWVWETSSKVEFLKKSSKYCMQCVREV
jgi:hypothetical protein